MRILIKTFNINPRTLFSTQIAALLILLLSGFQIMATTDETFNSGAYIINMGEPQTEATGLKPYGLVYQLIVNEHIPIRWAINPDKQKDAEDFSINSTPYKGGSFIIPVEYLSADIIDIINTWRGYGVEVDGPIASSFTAPIYSELTSWPRAILDEDNGHIVANYYITAGIPSSSYVLAGNPTDLSGCSDIYVLPHADPHEWPTSYGQALYDFVVNDKGYLWAACHAVSSLETLVDFTGDGNPDCNFLSDTQLQLWDNNHYPGYAEHTDGTPPYTYNNLYSGDPIMQFMGDLDAATQEGSEQIYIPMIGMSWRSSTKNAVYDPDHSDDNSRGYASVLAYGHAFGNPNYGMIMYEAGHQHDKNSHPANIAAQRAFFNFILMAGTEKQITSSSTVPNNIISGATINVSASGSNGTPDYTYAWTSTCEGGSFDNPENASTTYTAPIVSEPTTCVITVEITDNCERFSFSSTSVVVSYQLDTDGDGVSDVDDDYPEDETRAFDNYYPAEGTGTLAYEDLWPSRGDYDFNDLIVDYNFMTVSNASNKIVETFGTFIVRAIGASTKNGFGFQLANSNIASSDITNVSGYDLQEGYINLAANGIEEGHSIPTIIVFDNAFNILPHPGSGLGVNTTLNAPYVAIDTVTVHMVYTPDTYTISELDMPNFNPFLIKNMDRGIEVHLPDYIPTDLADQSYFGTFDDDTNIEIGKYYKTENNLPWVINIPQRFDYPIEKVSIDSVFLHFIDWAEDNGTSFQDWYMDNSGYRNNTLIYTH